MDDDLRNDRILQILLPEFRKIHDKLDAMIATLNQDRVNLKEMRTGNIETRRRLAFDEQNQAEIESRLNKIEERLSELEWKKN